MALVRQPLETVAVASFAVEEDENNVFRPTSRGTRMSGNSVHLKFHHQSMPLIGALVRYAGSRFAVKSAGLRMFRLAIRLCCVTVILLAQSLLQIGELQGQDFTFATNDGT